MLTSTVADLGAMTMLASDGEPVVMMMACVGGLIAIVAIVTGSIEKVKIARAKEESRREIAAYIAEGSITPEDGRKLIESGGSLVDKVRDAVAGRSS